MSHSRLSPFGAVRPLITAEETYPVLERRAVSARNEITLCFRVFDTRTTLRTAEARQASGGEDWAALLVALAARGVKVRLQISDFDPVAGAALHREAWASLFHLDAVARGVPAANKRLEAMAARHEAELGLFWRLAFLQRARREVRKIISGGGDHGVAAYPGLKPVIEGRLPRLYPATHHQKLAVIDDDFALIGGIDVDERRWDGPDHDRPAEDTWRDVSLCVEGSAAAPVAEVASSIWTDCAAAWAKRDDLTIPITNLAVPTPLRPKARKAEDAAADAVVTTWSAPRSGLFAFSPRTVRNGTEETVMRMIRDARRFIYVETQFLRSDPVAKALADAAARNPELELVVVLPFAPERFAFKKKRDTAMRHGEALQHRALTRIRDAFGERSVFLSPAKPGRSGPDDAFIAFGAGIVYVHSKILIVDGETALVGSANLNGRSLRWDTEASFLWRDPDGVAEFLSRLGASLIGGKPANLTSAATWRDAAEANAAISPAERRGFLLPHDMRRAARFSRRSFWLPDELF